MTESLTPVNSAVAPSLVTRKDRVGFVLSKIVPYLRTFRGSEPVFVTAAVTLMSSTESTWVGAVYECRQSSRPASAQGRDRRTSERHLQCRCSPRRCGERERGDEAEGDQGQEVHGGSAGALRRLRLESLRLSCSSSFRLLSRELPVPSNSSESTFDPGCIENPADHMQRSRPTEVSERLAR